MHHTFAVAVDGDSESPKLLSLTLLPSPNALTHSIDMARIGQLCDESKDIQTATLRADVVVSRDGNLPRWGWSLGSLGHLGGSNEPWPRPEVANAWVVD